MTMTTLVLTALGDDRPGLVSTLSATLTAHGAGWEQSRMARLAGTFAGIVQVQVPSEQVEPLTAALASLAGQGLRVQVEHTDPESGRTTQHHLHLELLGADRPGILAEISALLADAGVSIEELSTEVREAPMAGGLLFEAHARLVAPSGLDDDALRTALESVADELMVEIALEPGPEPGLPSGR